MEDLRTEFISSLRRVFELEQVATFSEFFQGELRVLLYLFNNEGKAINPSAISDEMHVSRTRVTATLNSLRDKGYVAMGMNQVDRRRVDVTLTQSGRKYVRARYDAACAEFEYLRACVGDDKIRGSIESLNEIANLFEQRNEKQKH